ncbi:MAG TPA: dihydrolipoyl dehydrogenase [Dokdonella sp.]|uniref:dihydrolipoyl dehydrogenase n=1 Tax=Dokdonella sp. TaxID=2291710 RepID=UPI002C1AB6EA|nr:dihydrolipoyl dehydrogenase [Xanthomonadales bacterium]HQV72314.1 dihydrolipoyl dehydrogenase [Dokdonella sp.]MBK7210189.1 dihydrolipoyl dehydrogenase [Xanthomonadales bacterium]MBL0223638.1 dihydrolipoyl dehydrogenase [Xanthomonadales bacterium]HQW76662.1 dihydrolipoyl dehydrogenase [Dokdonella sp.]
MADTIEIKVPDIGGSAGIPVIEVLVKAGESVRKNQGIVTLESDKATMEVPSPADGVIRELKVKLGDSASEGTVVAILETAGASAAAGKPAKTEAAAPKAEPARKSEPSTAVPDAVLPPASMQSSAAPSRQSLPAGEAQAAPKSASVNSETPAPKAAAASGRKADIECQVVVLGSGPGGYTAAFRAADLGQDTVLIERHDTLGGVCLNVGCIPSKALLHAGRVIEEAAHAEDIGLSFGKPKIDLDKLRASKDKVVKQLTGGLASMAKQRKVAVVNGTGKFVSANEIEVEGKDGKKLVRFGKAIIAAGSQAVKLPGFPWDDKRMMDSTDALDLADIPKKLLVVGGGIIGLEMACVYDALGSEVTVVELLDQLMPGADIDLVRPLQQRLSKRYAGIHLKVKVAKIEAEKKGLKATFEGDKAPEPQLYDRVLVAVGRSANGGKVNAEAAGVKVSERGFIAVDKQMRTNVPHIFAIGDLVGQPMLAHKATHEGKVAAEVASGRKSEFVARVIPSVAYTDPEIAWVGLTETEAKKAGIAYGVGKFPHAASGRAIGIGRTEGFTKLLFDEATHRVIGAGIVAPNAGDLIAEIALAIEMGCEAADIGLTIHPHPTLSESVGMAAEVYEGTITDLYIPKKQ